MIENRIAWQNLLFSKQIEGGYSPPRMGDPNPTNHGITLTALQRARKPAVVTTEDLKNLTIEEAKAICNTFYWSPVRGDQLTGGVDIMVGDTSFNSGPSQATKLLQRCLGFDAKEVDGFLEVRTLIAVQSVDPVELIVKYHDARMAFLRHLPNWASNANGWTARCDTVKALALKLAPHEAPAAVASADSTRRSAAMWIGAATTAASTAIPAVISALPAAKQSYDQMADAIGPVAEILPWIRPVAGIVVFLAVIFLAARASTMAHNANSAGSTATVVAAPASATPELPVPTASVVP